ncbi:anhydro-N-acetylmuramic acid kinase [Alcanivorax xiamenensis]|uniref:Anhydro-N-acetylmuramic acid kinase n=1 Tax=Alcanivorax xiamenensis TaxID=1177156 RepID=A0ABQ6Y2R4_9GAMM|nr:MULTISPECIES: anhydro-N-acetylmuramic acid kinase [Alcanivorax]KAF0802547.1 anhydro-N-acetylmuramic acid kinase [Alcanivorax xiamenensis]
MSGDGLYIGLMTGTSVDGIDAVLARIGKRDFQLLTHQGFPLPDTLRDDILRLCRGGPDEIDQAGRLHRRLGDAYAHATRALLARSGHQPDQIHAVGCHGQTVRHRPGDPGFSVQLGCPDTLAVHTGIPVVSNFRNKDMVLGGQGAPLVPRFHQQLFGAVAPRVAVVNIGGMANVSLLDGGELIGGFDTGPGNVLMDLWVQQHQGEPYDQSGAWAAGGTLLPDLLSALLADPYFQLPPPKSTGREHFNEDWLRRHLPADANAQQVQSTLAELTARSIADAVEDFAPQQLLVCGGGAHNQHLLARLSTLLGIPVRSTEGFGLHPDWVEASAFAWLAWARIEGETGNAPSVTGASRAAVLGQLTLP